MLALVIEAEARKYSVLEHFQPNHAVSGVNELGIIVRMALIG